MANEALPGSYARSVSNIDDQAPDSHLLNQEIGHAGFGGAGVGGWKRAEAGQRLSVSLAHNNRSRGPRQSARFSFRGYLIFYI